MNFCLIWRRSEHSIKRLVLYAKKLVFCFLEGKNNDEQKLSISVFVERFLKQSLIQAITSSLQKDKKLFFLQTINFQVSVNCGNDWQMDFKVPFKRTPSRSGFFFFHHAPIRTLHAKSMRIICITIRNQQGGYCTQGPLKVIQGQWSFDPLEALVREGTQQTEIRKRMLISVDINHATNRPKVSHFLKKIIYIFHSKNFVDPTQSPSLYIFWLIFTVLIVFFFYR